MTYDLHIHPLNHKYYNQSGIDYASVVLDDDDKANIRAVVDWCCHVRRLDVIGITDHDMIQASLYAREYAKENKLPIQIVTGAECELIDPKAPLGSMPMHLLCLGLERLPNYTSQTPIQQMYDHVRALGGVMLMSHPGYYPESYYSYHKFLAGYEYDNGAAGRFEDELSSPYIRHPYLYHCSNSDFHYRGKLPQSALFTTVENSNSDDIFAARKNPTSFVERLHPSREEQTFAIKRLRDNELLLWMIEHMDDPDVVHAAIDAYTDQDAMYELLKSGKYFKSDYEAHLARRITSPYLTNRLIRMPLGDSALKVLIQAATDQKAIEDIFETSDNGSILVTALRYLSSDTLYRVCMLDGKFNCFCGDKAKEFERLSRSKDAPWRNHKLFDLRLVELRDIYIRKITDQQALLDITLHSPHAKIRNEAMYMLSPDTLKQLVLKTKKLNLQLYAIRELEQINLLTEIAASCVNPKVAEEAEKRRRVVLAQTLVSNTTPENELYELAMKHSEIETQERAILFMDDRENLRQLIADHPSPEIRKAADGRLESLMGGRPFIFISSSDLD